MDNITNRLLSIGTKLQGGKYVVKEQLSSGGFGNTYVIVDNSFEDRFALKEFFISGVNERNDDNTTISISNGANIKLFESQKEKFKKEARRLRKLNNPHIVRVYDLFEENNTAYYVMDYVEGESLLSRLKRTNTPLSEKEAMSVLAQVLDALEVVHNLKIWHLDLKPANIIIDKDGNIVLIDFGASKQFNNGDGYETTTMSMCYTPRYAPLEQVDQNMDRIGPWTDLYALGATLYNLITCTPPPTVSEINEGNAFSYPDNITKKTKELIEWMMTPNRNDRPQSVAEVRDFLEKDIIPHTDEDTIIGGISLNNQSDRNEGNSVVNSDEATIINSGQTNNNVEAHDGGKDRVWSLYILLGVAIIVIVLGLSNTCSYNKAQQAPVDTDSIVEVVDSVIDSLAVDTVAADSVIVDDYYRYY